MIGDNYLDGTYAWLNAYHGTIPQSQIHFPQHYFTNMVIQISTQISSSLPPASSGTPSTLITADTRSLTLACSLVRLHYRHPLQAKSTPSPYAEGLNGRLPNQDLINSLRLISHYTGGVPLVLYDHLELHDAPQHSLLANAPEFMKRSPQLREFEYRARNVKRHVSYQGRGQPSGAHGLFHR